MPITSEDALVPGCGAAQLLEQSAQLLDLGDDALRLCFAHLPLDGRACLAATCRRLRAMATHAPLWTELRFRGTRAPAGEDTLCALIERARALAGAAFSCLDLDGSNVAGELKVVPLPQLRLLYPLLTGTTGVGAQLSELRLGDCAALPPGAAIALASKDTFPLLQEGGTSFRLAVDEPGIARLARGEALPRGCSVSLEPGRCIRGRSLRDALVDDTFAAALSAVAAAGGTLYHVSTRGHHHDTRSTRYRAEELVALVTLAPAAFAPLASLDLRDCIMPQADEQSAFAAALAGCTQLARVTLSRQHLWPAVLRAFAALPSLTSLDISYARLCDYMPAHSVFTAAAWLRVGLLDAAARGGGAARPLALDATGCALHDTGAAELAAALADGARLRELRLGNNGITCVGATALAQAIQDGARADARRGAVFPLRTLSLAQNKVRHAGAVALARALSAPGVCVTALDLGKNEFGDAGAGAFASALAMPGCPLRELMLDGCGVSALGAAVLARALVGDGTAAASGCAAASALHLLDLGNSQLCDAGAAVLAHALAAPRCSLTHLLLHGCGCGPRGAKAFAAALRRNTTLEQLRLTGCSVREEGMNALLAAMGGDGDGGDAGDNGDNNTNVKVNVHVSDWPDSGDACDEAMDRLGERLTL